MGLFVVLWNPPKQDADLIFSIFLILLTLSCLTYTMIQAHNRLHRYAESMYFFHYVNHTVRDYVAQVVFCEERDRNLSDLLTDVLTSIATCFSIVTGKQCRCCIKELKQNQEIVTVERDNISAKQAESQRILRSSEKHIRDDNTDFYNLWYAEPGCQRAYLSNDLSRDFRLGRYKNSSFEILGTPEVSSFLGYTYVEKWTLPYRSALVVPIRYISEFKPPSRQDKGTNKNPNWRYWGFLCIDCNNKNIFDYRYTVELGGAFADLLYSFFIGIDFAMPKQENVEKQEKENKDTMEQMDIPSRRKEATNGRSEKPNEHNESDSFN